MVYGNGSFLGWNAAGDIISSPDGVVWTSSAISTPSPFVPITNNPINGWNSVAYGGGKFVALRLSNNGTGINGNYSAVSYDNGITWNYGFLPNANPTAGGPTSWNNVIYAGNMFVASGSWFDNNNSYYTGAAAYSTDGIYWTTNYNSADNLANVTVNNTAYGNGILLNLWRVTNSGTVFGSAKSTNKGIIWAASGSPTPQLYYNSMAYGAGLFVAVGGSSTNTNTTSYSTSPDGTTWTSRSSLPVSLNWKSITYANGYFVAVGQDSSGAAITTGVATSTDGLTWTSRTINSSQYRGSVAGGKGKFIFSADATGGTIINLSVSASSFSLPMPPAMRGTTPYIKAT